MSSSQTTMFEGGSSSQLVPLAELKHGQEGDFFALLVAKEELTTKDGKPYFRVAFRDAGREVSFPIWNDTTWATVCREEWSVGDFYKLRAQYRDTNFGPQLEIRKIRPVNEEDYAEGFDPAMCVPPSRFDPKEMFEELATLVKDEIADEELATLFGLSWKSTTSNCSHCPPAKYNHHGS